MKHNESPKVALIVFSSRGRLYEYANNSVKATIESRGRLYEYANNSVKATIERYKTACSDSPGTGSTSEANAQFYQQEAEKL
ncbi:hypothetical protein RYX36_025657, partial [Vicia faba]